jgi:hypothetical protein
MSTAPHGAGDAGLPPPSREARAHGDQVFAHVAASIGNAGGWISFAGYMAAVMYAPGLGYYSAGARKFGSAGDFVTAPELTPLFGAAVAAVGSFDVHGLIGWQVVGGPPIGRVQLLLQAGQFGFWQFVPSQRAADRYALRLPCLASK